MGAKERAFHADRQAIQKDFAGPRTIAFINPKGGAAKTTGVLGAGYTFGTVRGGGVVAWDNNETRGTLGIRGQRGSHRNTTRELLEDLGRFKDVYQSRIGDLGAFVRSQGDAHFDVLASDERPDVTGIIHAADFAEVHALLQRFYRVILIDTGNNMRAENWLAAAEAADLLVVTSTIREDTGYSGLWMLDALQDAGYANLKHKTITVLSDPSDKVDARLASDLVQVYEQRTRGVYRVPYDPALVSGSVVPYGQLSAATQRSWLAACAAMTQALSSLLGDLLAAQPVRPGRRRGPLLEGAGEAARVGVPEASGDLGDRQAGRLQQPDRLGAARGLDLLPEAGAVLGQAAASGSARPCADGRPPSPGRGTPPRRCAAPPGPG